MFVYSRLFVYVLRKYRWNVGFKAVYRYTSKAVKPRTTSLMRASLVGFAPVIFRLEH